MSQYDNAQHNLESTVKETNELERRANQAGVELVKAADTLSSVRSEVKDIERKKSKQERLLRDINQVLIKICKELKLANRTLLVLHKFTTLLLHWQIINLPDDKFLWKN